MNTAAPHCPASAVRLLAAAALASLAVVGAGCSSSHPAQPAPQASGQQPASSPGPDHLRLGTYDSRAIAVAYARSDVFAKSMKDLTGRYDQAKAAGKQSELKSLEGEGQSRQVRLHLQTFSNAPVDDALDPIRAQLPAIARQRGVAAIVPAADFHDGGVELIDLTDDLVRLYNPTPQTIKIVKDLRHQKPMPIERIAKMPADE